MINYHYVSSQYALHSEFGFSGSGWGSESEKSRIIRTEAEIFLMSD